MIVMMFHAQDTRCTCANPVPYVYLFFLIFEKKKTRKQDFYARKIEKGSIFRTLCLPFDQDAFNHIRLTLLPCDHVMQSSHGQHHQPSPQSYGMTPSPEKPTVVRYMCLWRCVS
jgi:hypothetical protein